MQAVWSEFGTSPATLHIAHIPESVISSDWQAIQLSLSIVGISPGLGQSLQVVPASTNWLAEQDLQEMRSLFGTSPVLQLLHSADSSI